MNKKIKLWSQARQTNTCSTLRNLQSTIYHAKEIEKDIDNLTRLLKEQTVNPKIYQPDQNIDTNLRHFQEIFSGGDDVVIRRFLLSPSQQKAALIYIEDMADQAIINNHILEKLTCPCFEVGDKLNPANLAAAVTTILTAGSLTETTEIQQAVQRILTGDTMLLLDGVPTLYIIATRKVKLRSVAPPDTEPAVIGPRDSFIEDLRTNITLIRRRINNPNLVIQKSTVGRRSHTEIAVTYLKGVVNYKYVCEVERRLNNLKIDIPENLTIPNLIGDHPYSPFPTAQQTERPDRLVSALSKGKVGIIVDGTPFAIIVPTVLSDLFRAVDDYHEKWMIATAIRILRYISAFLALSIPAMYIAITAFHPAMIPTPLALTIGISREGVPLPSFLEALIMISFLEIMHEAGIRLPRTVGQAVSIVGGLVIGDATVRAGLVSSPLVIITSFTAIATFSIPDYRLALAVRLLRLPLMAAGASFGMYGVMIGQLLIIVHLSIMESFGEPYLAPFTAKNMLRLQDLKDTYVVAPPSARTLRPTYLEPEDVSRQNPDK